MKTYLGDAVMAAPLAERLESHCRVAYLTSSAVAEVLHHGEGNRVLLPFVKSRSLLTCIRQARLLRRFAFDSVLLVNHSFRSAFIAKLARISRRVGHDREGRRALLTEALPYDSELFEAYSVGQLSEPLGVSLPRQRPRIMVSEPERRRGTELLEGATIGLQPGARFFEKQIPFQATVAIARGLQAKGERIALLGGREEAELSERLADALNDPPVNLVGRTTLRETIGCLASLRATLGADTGVMHLSAGVGCPTVQVFGPTSATKWGHDYPPHRVISAPGGDMANVSAEHVLETVLHAAAR